MRLLVLLLLVGLALAAPLTKQDEIEVPIDEDPATSKVAPKLVDESQNALNSEKQAAESFISSKELDEMMGALLDAMLEVLAEPDGWKPAPEMPADVSTSTSPAEHHRAELD